MTNEHILAKLRAAIPNAQNGQKEILKEAGLEIVALTEQIAKLQNQVAHLEAEFAAGPLPEAPGSINLRMVDPETGATAQFTFRYHSEAKALAAWPGINRDLASLGLVSEEAYRKGAVTSDPPTQPKTNGNLPPVTGGQPAPTYSGEELSFEATELEGERKKGKNYWKVKGGKYAKFGVTIWEEALKAAGFDFESLNADETYNLSGYTAFYVMDEENKNPKKVTRLVRN